MVNALDLSAELPPSERYLFKPFYGSSHHWALTQLSGEVSGKRVLDIGAGAGVIGQQIRPKNPAQLVAIEIDRDTQPLLQGTYNEVYSSIAPLVGRQFDRILLLDVLEHMADPFAFLRDLAPLIAPGATLLISVPNVAHWSVRTALLFGRFQYRSRGILDRTHLHFFTRRSFRELCRSIEGATVTQIASSIEPLELLLPRWAVRNPLFTGLSYLRQTVANALPGLMAYQHLAVITKDR